ncbi:MAG: tetratricopeptide repeat protein [Ignavibacteriales bacterium]|nr:tetratricopeptide repeat protein [Ignavibacteriales bacterium]
MFDFFWQRFSLGNFIHPPLFKLSIYILSLLFVYSPNIYNQTLTADKIYKKVSDAVVVILAYDSNNELSTQGSGVVINDKGYVVTNYHVLAGNDRLEVLHNKDIVPYVDIIGIDVEKDILILKIDDKKFPSIKIGESKNLTIGQRVYAVGSPLGFENTISEGIISGLRSYEESGKDFIQITASISPGSSGGAVVNDKGELIGISTLTIKEGQNLNFAVPINDVLSVEISSYSKNNTYKNFELFDKGNNEYKIGNYQEAIKYYTNYIKEYPNDAGAYNNRGLAKDDLGDYRGAIQDYNKAIYLDPNNTDAYNNRGNAKSNLEDYRGAIQDYNKTIGIDPNDAGNYYNRGSAKSNLEDYRGAIQDFNKAIEINPNYADAYNNRGVAKKNLEDYRGAIQDYNKAIDLNPNCAEAYNNRGIAKYQLEDKSGACLDWSKAGELGDDKAYDMIRKYCK